LRPVPAELQHLQPGEYDQSTIQINFLLPQPAGIVIGARFDDHAENLDTARDNARYDFLADEAGWT
jgi:hypothetical protein